MNLSLAQIRATLERYTPRDLAESGQLAQAAVAMIVRECGEPEILMIRRAEHPLDPWSGHMAFPGGRVEPGDASTEHTAVRETFEELGISLEVCARRLARLSEIRARSRSGLMPLSIVPYVYELTRPVLFQRNQEVVEALWIPLAFFLSPANRADMQHSLEGVGPLPCYHFGGRVIWGLSLAMLDELVDALVKCGPPG